MRNAARVILWVFLVFICVTASHLVANTGVAAQGGLQVDKASIGGTITNAATGKPEAATESVGTVTLRGGA